MFRSPVIASARFVDFSTEIEEVGKKKKEKESHQTPKREGSKPHQWLFSFDAGHVGRTPHAHATAREFRRNGLLLMPLTKANFKPSCRDNMLGVHMLTHLYCTYHCRDVQCICYSERERN